MLLLVTGGAGFIGSHFIRLVLKRRPTWRVINLDKLTYSGNPENLRDVEDGEGGKRYFFVQGDICDAAIVEALFCVITEERMQTSRLYKEWNRLSSGIKPITCGGSSSRMRSFGNISKKFMAPFEV